jgi:hypothetical protein
VDNLIAIALVIIGILGNIFAAEICDWAPSAARLIVRRAASKLPGYQRQRYEEEWLSHLEEYPGKITQVLQACRCAVAGHKLRNAKGDRIQKAMLSILFFLYEFMIERNRMLWANFMKCFVFVLFDGKCKYKKITSDKDVKRRLVNVQRIIRSHSTVKNLFIQNSSLLISM